MEQGSWPYWHLWFKLYWQDTHTPNATALLSLINKQRKREHTAWTNTLLNSCEPAPSSAVFSDLQTPSLSSLSHAVHLPHYILCTRPAFSVPWSLLTRSLSLCLTLVSFSQSLPLPFWPHKLSWGMIFLPFLIVSGMSSCNSCIEVNQQKLTFRTRGNAVNQASQQNTTQKTPFYKIIV